MRKIDHRLPRNGSFQLNLQSVRLYVITLQFPEMYYFVCKLSKICRKSLPET